MIIKYNIPFAKYRKIARTYCKIIQKIKAPFAKRTMLKNFDAEHINYRDIPVIINNFNRINYLKTQIEWLEKAGMRHIYIIDNASSFEPLLNFYKNTQHTVIMLNANIGYKALWETSIHLWFKGLPYIYTDPDVIPINDCPLNAVEYFQHLLNQYPAIHKVGFGLKIDDIPDFYPRKKEVLSWEAKYWNNPIAENLFKADIDTTFALYRAHSVKQQWKKTIRTGGLYLARHLPWYENPNILADDELYFQKKTKGTGWYFKHQIKI